VLTRKRIVYGLVAVVAWFAVIPANFANAQASAAINYVVAGDSMSSGEAAPIIPLGVVDGRPVGHPFAEEVDYMPGTFNKCDRAKTAWPLDLAAKHSFNVQANVACAGATIDSFLHTGQWGEPAQLDAIRGDTNLVSFTLGGNDIGFPDIVACDMAKECVDDDRNAVLNTAKSKLKSLQGELKKVIDAVRTRAPRAKIVVVGYADEFAAPGALGPGCLGLVSDDERATANKIKMSLNTASSGAVADAQATGIDVMYVDPSGPLDPIPGYENTQPVFDACSIGPAHMMTGIQPDRPASSFHLNWLGNQAYTQYIGKQLPN
jgi:lysophospholipase L1-like esterase